MKKNFLILLLMAFTISLNAAYLVDVPITVTQPNGVEINCFASGDEFYNWIHDENNFTIIQNSKGYYCYGILDGDKVVPSEYIVGEVDPASVGLQPGINISAQARYAIRKSIEDKTPAKSTLKNYREPKGPKNTGTMNNLVVFIRFSDQEEYTTDTLTYWSMFNKEEDNYQSLYSYFKQTSYDQLHIKTSFFPISETTTVVSYQDDQPRQYYMPYNSYSAPLGYNGDNQRTQREHMLLKKAIEYVESQVPADLDLDYNNDGLVDNVVFVIKGGTTDWSTLLWPHRWVLYTYDVMLHGKQVYDYNFQLSNHLYESGSSVLCHEMFHSLGAPDLYRYSNNSIDPVGPWDIMCSNTIPAQSMSTYMKYKYGGWVNSIPEITEGGLYTLHTPWSETNNAYKIASPNSNYEYFIVEFRNKDHFYESQLPGEGILIYRINPYQSGNADGPPDEVYIFRPGGTNTYSNGYIQRAHFNDKLGRDSFNDYTDPPAFLSNGNPGGIFIQNIKILDSIAQFEVIFDIKPEAEFEASQLEVPTNCGVDFESESFFFVDEYFWEFEDATPSTSTEKDPKNIKFNSNGLKTVSLTVTNEHGSTTNTKEDYINVSTEILPEANFESSLTTACVNVPVEFTDISLACPITWKWTFSPNDVEFVDGTSENSQNPKVSFKSNNSYTVTLDVANANGSSTITKEDYITTFGLDAPQVNQDFQDAYNLPQIGWTVENPDNDVTWELAVVPYEDDPNFCLKIELNEYENVLEHDYVYLPILNLDKRYKLKFDHAYAMTHSPYSDTLIVSISVDCGDTWEKIGYYYEDGTYNFATAEPSYETFVPEGAQDWCGNDKAPCNEIDLSAYEGLNTVKIRFESVRTAGNNLYLDNIRFEEIIGIEDEDNVEISIYPNPSKDGIFYIETENQNININVFDITGKLVYTQNNIYGKDCLLDLSNQKSGIYFVNINNDKFNKNLKVIIK